MGLRTSSIEYLGLKFVRLETSVISSKPGSSKVNVNRFVINIRIFLLFFTERLFFSYQ
jgi:hypothetical protein